MADKRLLDLYDGEFTNLADSTIVLLPVCFDETSTWIKGADKGPAALLDAWPNMEFYDIETDSEVFKLGINVQPSIAGIKDPEKMVEAVEKEVTQLLDNNKFTIVLGGEHSVSVGTINAHARKFDNLTILQLDAHADLRDEYEGSKYNHACVMARARETANIVQVGIRSMELAEKANGIEGSIFYAHNLQNDTNWIDQVVEKCTENVYLTIDLDVFDPSIMPGTGTPEPGGLGWYPVLQLIRKLIEKRSLIGCDIVELCPITGSKVSEFLAARLLYKILSYKFHQDYKSLI